MSGQRERGSWLVAREGADAAQARQRAVAMLALACRDDLTGALTRRAGRERLTAEINRARRRNSSLCLVFADVDGLKAVNDERGHRAGDELLGAIGKALRSSVRTYDLVIRYGGDEFVCALPDASQDMAVAVVARARRRASKQVTGAQFSVGYAILQERDQPEDVIQRADADMYARRRATRASPSPQSGAASPPNGHTDYPTAVLRATVGCGHCGEQIPLAHFSSPADQNAERFADCPICGETTVIRLVRPRGLG